MFSSFGSTYDKKGIRKSTRIKKGGQEEEKK